MDKGLILVTGATGFVGKWTVVEALKAGYRVRGTLRAASRAEMVRESIAKYLGEDPGSQLEFAECDLLDDTGWAEAMVGCSAVLHTAMVVRGDEPKDPEPVIRTAVEGTTRVLEAARKAGINRVVITESIATIGYGHGQTRGKRVYDETHFTNLENMRWTWAYAIGKTRAERAAWAYAREHGMELTTIHPGWILGPALDADASISVMGVTGLLDGTVPAMPNMGFCVIDVRDVAEMHVVALEKRESVGERYLATGRYVWFREVADILRKAYPERKVTTRMVPDWVMRVLVHFGGPVRQVIDDIGNEKHYDPAKGQGLLGRSFRSAEEAVVSAADSCIALGLVKTRR